MFPLYERAREEGLLESGNALIVAPTATGKSFIGRAIIRAALQRGEPGVHVYLVPYRALAAEIASAFRQELHGKDQGRGRQGIQVKLATGDHTDPIYPTQTNVLVATYERFSSLLPVADLRLGRVVVDEVHLIADEGRGPLLEGLITRMLTFKRPSSLCLLSAAVANPEELAAWLRVPLLMGSQDDRTVQVEFHCNVTDDVDQTLLSELRTVLERGEQAIVFCRSKAASQAVARQLRPVVSPHLTEANRLALADVAARASEADEDPGEYADLVADGVSFHHAGLTREARALVEAAFRERHLRVISCTPTLAAGVNLPARLVVVRDVYRIEVLRGSPKPVVLSTGELLNMLGRAGRPGHVESGRGVALVERTLLAPDELAELQVAIREGRGNPVRSRLPDSFDALMRFVLRVAADMGEVTLSDLADAVRRTLWHHQEPSDLRFDRPLEADVMEDIPSFKKVTESIRLERAWPVADGVDGTVVSGENSYSFSLRLTGENCTCPARSKWRKGDVCKHLACAIHSLLFDPNTDAEARNRALYAAAHRFRKTLDLGTKIRTAVDLLQAWGLVEPVPGGFRATSVGAVATSSPVDLLLIRTARERIERTTGTPSPGDVAAWLVDDFFADEKKRARWRQAVALWLEETDIKRIRLPERFRGDFERGLEELGQLATLYAEIAESIGKREVAAACRTTRGCLQYGVAPELLGLMALGLRQLGRARCRFLYGGRGVRTLEDLARADPVALAGPHAPLSLTTQWVEGARQIYEARRQVAAASADEAPSRVDEFLAQFKVDRLLLSEGEGLRR